MKKQHLIPVLLCAAVLSATGCGGLNTSDAPSADLAPVGTPDLEGAVIKARAEITVATGSSTVARLFNFLMPSAVAASGTTTVSTTLAASVVYTLDNSLLAVPTNPTAFAVNDFGFLQISALKDNGLKVCGTNGKTKCTQAIIRMYTTGTAGAGLWNSSDSYGAPITAGQSTLSPVGLDAAGAVTLQQIAIAPNKNTVRLSDFANPKYNVMVDFTDAGAGAYSSTLVVEYLLAL